MADKIIYLDNNATTAAHPEVVAAMAPYWQVDYGNPSSAYQFGAKLRPAVAHAREQVAALIGARPEEIVFTSGGTESNNAALWSALQLQPEKKHLVTTAVEHSAIIKTAKFWEKQGYSITAIPVDAHGQIETELVREFLRADTALLSVMWANNETGVVSPIAELAAIAQEHGIPFHTDAVQAGGKISVDVAELPIAYLSLSAHKLHGPKGIGALYIRSGTRFVPFFHGGSQERGYRAGTENVPGIVGFGQAAAMAHDFLQRGADNAIRTMRDYFEMGVTTRLENCSINGSRAPRTPNTSNITFADVEAEALLLALDAQGICCSTGSACTTGSISPSHVLTAMGLSDESARSSLRFSLSRHNTMEEMETVIAVLEKQLPRLKAMLGGASKVALHTDS